jgi:hypothetical protein
MMHFPSSRIQGCGIVLDEEDVPAPSKEEGRPQKLVKTEAGAFQSKDGAEDEAKIEYEHKRASSDHKSDTNEEEDLEMET